MLPVVFIAVPQLPGVITKVESYLAWCEKRETTFQREYISAEHPNLEIVLAPGTDKSKLI